MKIPQNFLIPYIIVNVVSVILFIITINSFKRAKILFGVLFILFGLFNGVFVYIKHNFYIYFLGKTAFFDFYRDFIFRDFRDNVILYGLLISVFQLLIGWFILQESNLLRYGIFGGIIFFILIAPLGAGSAFPSTIIMAISLYMIHVKIVKKAQQKMRETIL